MTISELIEKLKAIQEQHGDIPVRKLEYGKDEYEFEPYYKDIEEVWFGTDREEPEISVNPYADGFVVIE